jgi:hypothetical protein
MPDTPPAPKTVPEPRQCLYWDKPARIRDGTLKEHFELIEEYTSESHLRRYLLKCRECGQLYFFEFYEEIDWDEGKDPQYTKYIPVGSAEDAALFSRSTPIDLLDVMPCLRVDYPRDAEAPSVYWAGKPRGGWLTRPWRR